MGKRKNGKNLQRVWKQFVNKTSVRQWLLACLFFIGMLAVFIFDALPTGVSVEVGQVAKRDLTAPRTAVNRAATAKLRENAEKQVLLEVSEDPDYYDLNHAAVLRVEENLTGILNLLRSSIPQSTAANSEQEQEQEAAVDEETKEEEQEPLSTSEVDRRLIRDWKIEIPNSILEEIAKLN